MAQLLLPFTGNLQRSAFASWLDQNLVDDPNATTAGVALGEDLRAQIRELSHEAEDLSTLIREASVLVADHSDLFRIPLHHGMNSGSWATVEKGVGDRAGDQVADQAVVGPESLRVIRQAVGQGSLWMVGQVIV